MKLNTEQAKLFSLMSVLNPGDPLLDTVKTLGEVPDVPTFRAALARRAADMATAFSDLAGALGGTTPTGQIPTIPGSVEVPGTATERIMVWMRANPTVHSPKVIREGLTMPLGTFGEAAKALQDQGVIVAEGKGAGRTYRLK